MDDALQDFAVMIRREYGLDFTKKLTSLHAKTKARVQELGCTYREYCARLKTDIKEREKLVELLTIHETYFFRENHQLNVLCENVLPGLIERSIGTPGTPIRIWSAACSTGEEPYSMAILIHEMLRQHAGKIQIHATDIDHKTLAFAKQGLYSSKSFTFRRMPDGYIDRYFDKVGESFQVRSDIRRMVEFKQLNLFDTSAVTRMSKMDVIFCRNVLIYFDDDGRRQVIQSLHDQLKPTGYLFVGHAERIQNLDSFRSVQGSGTFYYQKEGGRSWAMQS